MSGVAETHPATRRDFVRLEPGFRDPVRGAQVCFRVVLDAMAHPGRIVDLPPLLGGSSPAPLSESATAIALTLCDIDTPIWLDRAASPAAGYLAFHCGAPMAERPGDARFAIVADAVELPPLDRFKLGSDEYPERSATLVIAVSGLSSAFGIVLRGPGISGETRLGVGGLPARFWGERAALAELFPRGVEVLFVDGKRLAAVPRSTQIMA